MTEFRIAYTVEGETTPDAITAYVEDKLLGYDVEVQEIHREIPEGWYQLLPTDPEDTVISFWSAEELSYQTYDRFMEDRIRVHPPVPFDAPVFGEFKDGYYKTRQGVSYKRVNGKWFLYLQNAAEWIPSSCDDKDFEADPDVPEWVMVL